MGGSTCDGNDATVCDGTKYVSKNQCVACPAGHSCDGTSKTQCGATQWVDQNACTKCPDGYTCNGHSKARHGGWTMWADSTSCSVTCGSGTKDQTRSCTNPSPDNGNDCSGLDGGASTRSVACSMSACPPTTQEYTR